MANPLQPKCVKIIEQEFGGYCVVTIASNVSGHMDILACVQGLFYGLEIKWRSDQPSELQKQKINDCIDAGGKAFFIRSEQELRDVLNGILKPQRYKLKNHFVL